MKKLLKLIILIFCVSLNAQDYYSNKRVEGYIFQSNHFKKGNKHSDAINIKVSDIECFEKILKAKKPEYYSEFYRQYYSRRIDGKDRLYVNLVMKNLVGNIKYLQNEIFVIIDACKSIRGIIYDIQNQKIIYDEDSGGCDS